MYKILKAEKLADKIYLMDVEAPRVAKHCEPGQFVIVKMDDKGERIPLTICDYDREAGTITIVFQVVGASTQRMTGLEVGDSFRDFVGPLGRPTDLSEYKNIVLVGGGIGSAVIYPQAKHLAALGNPATVIVGARNKELIMYEDEFRAAAKDIRIATDDGSYGVKGFVTDVLKEILEKGEADCVMAVGPMPMMRAVSELTRAYGVKTVVSMNPLMVDGTGMCGCCRVTVGGKTRYACVDGPEFDGHEIDWSEAMTRLTAYKQQEKEHLCRLTGEKR